MFCIYHTDCYYTPFITARILRVFTLVKQHNFLNTFKMSFLKWRRYSLVPKTLPSSMWFLTHHTHNSCMSKSRRTILETFLVIHSKRLTYIIYIVLNTLHIMYIIFRQKQGPNIFMPLCFTSKNVFKATQWLNFIPKYLTAETSSQNS